MNISLEISMYPLREDFIPVIDDFLKHLHRTEGIKVHTNPMSTQVFGPIEKVFPTVQNGIEKAYGQGGQCPFVIKVLNSDVSGAELDQNQWR